MKNLLQNVLLFALFTEGGYAPLLAQTEAYRGWSEPFFNDNAAEFNAEAGSVEFSPYFGAFRSADGWGYDLGGEIEVVLTEKWAIEAGLYYTWFQRKGSPQQRIRQESAVAMRAALGVQYIFKNTTNQAWAVGADVLSPGWSPYLEAQTTGWGLKPNLIYGRRWRNGVDCQWRITPSFDYWNAAWQVGGTVQGAYFWQNDWLNIGIELGGGKEGVPLAFVAPQIGIYLGDFSVGLGFWQPTYFRKADAVGYWSFSVAYNWRGADW